MGMTFGEIEVRINTVCSPSPRTVMPQDRQTGTCRRVPLPPFFAGGIQEFINAIHSLLQPCHWHRLLNAVSSATAIRDGPPAMAMNQYMVYTLSTAMVISETGNILYLGW